MRKITGMIALAALATFGVKTIERLALDSARPTQRWIEALVSGEAARTEDRDVLQQRSEEVLPALIQALRQGNPNVERAYGLLWSVLPESLQNRLPQFLPAESVRANAAALVGQLGPAAKPAVPDLVRLLHDEVADGNAALSLGLIGPEAREAVPALIVAVQEQRAFAATALGKIGASAGTARPVLQAAASIGPEWLRHEAILALRQIRDARAKAKHQPLRQDDQNHASHSAA